MTEEDRVTVEHTYELDWQCYKKTLSQRSKCMSNWFLLIWNFFLRHRKRKHTLQIFSKNNTFFPHLLMLFFSIFPEQFAKSISKSSWLIMLYFSFFFWHVFSVTLWMILYNQKCPLLICSFHWQCNVILSSSVPSLHDIWKNTL
jgi:hypothetical protein